MDIKKGVGQNIQEARRKFKLTQEELAELIGIETISLSKIETGKSYPTSENLAKIAKILQVEPYEFFLFEKEKTKEELLIEIQNAIEKIKDDSKKLYLLLKMVKSLL